MKKTIAAAGLLLISGATLLAQTWNWYQSQRANSWIAALAQGQEPRLADLIDAAPEVKLARALQLKRQHRYDDALATLNGILNSGDLRLQTQIRYNLGNLYLEQALAKTETLAVNDVAPLLALAKQSYRQALTLDSDFWDAKYNLDVAMRLLPELDSIDSADPNAVQPKTPLWTTVPGLPRGLP